MDIEDQGNGLRRTRRQIQVRLEIERRAEIVDMGHRDIGDVRGGLGEAGDRHEAQQRDPGEQAAHVFALLRRELQRRCNRGKPLKQ